MVDRPWKRAERKVAKALNGKRIPINGRAGSDVVADGLGVEVKYRQALPKWLTDALRQAKDGAGDNTPLVVLCERGSRIQYVLIALSDFTAMQERKQNKSAMPESIKRLAPWQRE